MRLSSRMLPDLSMTRTMARFFSSRLGGSLGSTGKIRFNRRLAVTGRRKTRVGAEHDKAVAGGGMPFDRGEIAGGELVALGIIKNDNLITGRWRSGFRRAAR